MKEATSVNSEMEVKSCVVFLSRDLSIPSGHNCMKKSFDVQFMANFGSLTTRVLFKDNNHLIIQRYIIRINRYILLERLFMVKGAF